jgi:chaperonin cofactor prefoldin
VLAPQEANYAHQQELDMIPLMMQKDYSPKGWLGLILGTRLWYAMWDVDEDDDAAFERRLGSVIREIADRGKLMVAEAVPPAPAPAQALTPATAEPTVTHQSVSQPSSAALMPMSSSSCAPIATTTSSGAAVAMDVSAFLDLAQRMQAKADAQTAQWQAKLEAQHREMETQRQQLEELRLEAERQKHHGERMQRRLREEQVSTLQSRLEALHNAKLLTVGNCYQSTASRLSRLKLSC